MARKLISLHLLLFIALVFSMAFLFAAPAYAQENKPAKYQLPKLSQQQISALAGRMCMTLTIMPVDNTYDGAANLEKKMLYHFKINKNAPDYKLKLAQAWNEVSPSVICGANNGTFPTQHFYKRALAMNLHIPILEEFFFLDEVAFPIDPNAVEILENGRFVTLLDYMDGMLARDDASTRYNVGQVAGLRDIIIEYCGGKRVSEMTPEEIRLRTAGLRKK